MADRCEVIIVGAGPTGLMAACQLSRLGITFRIIEKNAGPTIHSRALAIHAASIEIFSQMGIVDQFLEAGKKVKAINYLVKGKVEKQIQLSNFGKGLTEFPFLLMLEQSKTERLLGIFLEKHGHKVEWNTEVINLNQDDSYVRATVRSQNQDKTITSRWLIGADGAKSFVRQNLNIPFGGQTYPQDLFVLDCKVNWKLKDDEMYIGFSDHSFAGFFPMPEDRCRIISFVPSEVIANEKLAFEDIEKRFAEKMQMDIKLSSAKWISRYRAHHRYVSHFSVGRCFLAGDAAHIHSPVGAQGMNTGLQDAFNLAWKLAFVLKGKATENILSTYEKERLPFAKRLVNTTDRAFAVTVSQSVFFKMMRMYVAPRLLSVLLKVKALEKLIFKTVSQIGISYSETVLTHKRVKNSFLSHAPQTGDRIPYVEFLNEIYNPVNIHKHVDGRSLHLLIFLGNQDEISDDLKKLVQRYTGTITFEVVPFTANFRKLYQAFGLTAAGLYLIRPDLYIAYRSSTMEAEALEEFLMKFLLPNDQ